MKSPILGGSYVARSINAADNRMVNLYPEVIPEGGKDPAFLSNVPGLDSWAIVGPTYYPTEQPTRGMIATYEITTGTPTKVLYVVSGDVAHGSTLYRVTDSTTFTGIGSITSEGPVSMASSGTQLFIACRNGDGYILDYSTLTLTQITDGDFPGSTVVTYLDGYFVFINGQDQKVWCTNLLDGLNIEPLNFASAEASSDPVVSVIANNGELWVFGTLTTEVWCNTGSAGFPFAPIQGVNITVGCVSNLTVCQSDNTLFWLGQDTNGSRTVYRASGYSPVRISTHGVEWQMQSYAVEGPPFAFYDPAQDGEPYALTYQQDGHIFYVLTFPKGNAGIGSLGGTWVYDTTTSAWHERLSYDFDTDEFTRYRGMFSVYFGDQGIAGLNHNIISDFENNYLYFYNPDLYSDITADGYKSIAWLRSWRALPTGANNLDRTAHHSLQIDCETGVQNALDPVTNPQMNLRWSDDGGHTWSNTHSTSMGASGDYSKRVIFRRLGMTMKLRDRVYEISGTDPVKIAIMGAELHISKTDA